MSQSQLARHLGISRQRLSQWERGAHSPGLGGFLGICLLLSLSVDELLTALAGKPAPSAAPGEPPP